MARSVVLRLIRDAGIAEVDDADLVDCRPVGDRLRIEVRDTGIGIPGAHLARIWEEFHQVANPECDRALGLGRGAAGRTPDVIVSDYRLRDSRIGTEAVPRVRAFCGVPVPAVILTGETSSECQHEVLLLGLGLAFKPVTPRQLGAALDRQMMRMQAAK
jgi:CheY-like chemotaxis protein